MNELIEHFLSEYVINPDPQYAVLLKGKWGCGKTYFIRKWLKTLVRKDQDENIITLEPVYVSAYGMASISELKIAIDREINPFFYTSAGKLIKNAGKIISRIALKTSFDLDSNMHDETTISASLDPFAFFKSESEEISGVKLLVFDDIERSQIDMKQLLGFINGFVEHCGCHVIVIGDEERLGERKRVFEEFKEKTIGREFEILPDITHAIDCFISEAPICEYLQSQRDFIIQCFVASKYDNLRILRQCLYDFRSQLAQIEDVECSNDNPFLHSILGSFIAVYYEYANNKELLLKWNESYRQANFVDEEVIKNIQPIQWKYTEVSKSCTHSLFTPEYVSLLTTHIQKGTPIVEYLRERINKRGEELLPWEKSHRFIDMTQSEFDKAYDLSIESAINSGRINNYQEGVVVAFLSYFHTKGIHYFIQAHISLVKKELRKRIVAIDKLSDLYELRKHFIQGCNYVENGKCGEPLNDIVEFFEHEFNLKKESLPDDMQIAIRSLSDKNVDSLRDIDASSYPDTSSRYELRPIFANEDASQIFSSLKAMSNKSRNTFSSFLASHYGFGMIFQEGAERYKSDYPVLVKLKSLIDTEIESAEPLDKYVFKLMSRDLSRCIKRAEGAAKI